MRGCQLTMSWACGNYLTPANDKTKGRDEGGVIPRGAFARSQDKISGRDRTGRFQLMLFMNL